MLQVRIGTVEHALLKSASGLEGVSVSEFVRQAIAKHTQFAGGGRQGAPPDLRVEDMIETYDPDAFMPRRKSADIKRATRDDSPVAP